MPRYDASQVEVLIFTFKEGILSAVAHDLKLRVTRLRVDWDGVHARAELEAGSLVVVNPMKDGNDNPSALPRMVYPEIEKNAAHDVLESKKFPLIRFTTSSVTERQLTGTLELHGKSRELIGTRTGAKIEFSFDQRDFGLKPYSAMLGTLKVKPEVKIVVAFDEGLFTAA